MDDNQEEINRRFKILIKILKPTPAIVLASFIQQFPEQHLSDGTLIYNFNQVAKKLNINRYSIGSIIKRELEDRGLVTLIENVGSRRRYYINFEAIEELIEEEDGQRE